MKKFEKAQKGDKVYSLLHGKGVVQERHSPSEQIVIVFDSFAGFKKYYLDGRYQSHDDEPLLFWSKPFFSVDVEPKRMVKKTITKYVNIYPDGNINMHSTSLDAQNKAGFHAVKIADPVTFEYEIIE